MLGRNSCCIPQKTCYNDTYDDYENKNGKNGFNQCRPSYKENLCNRIKRVQESSKILENVLDIASTLVKIMCVCGIHECKANKALDVIIYAFMHFDEVAEHPGGKCKKRIRKEEFYNDLMKDCGMTKAEAKLTYSIVKCAFKAFYHKQVVNKYDAGFVDECEWKNAANRTVNAFAQSGASRSETELTGRRIMCAYENYVCRLQAKKQAAATQQEDKCICGRDKRASGKFGGGEFGGPPGFDPCQPCPPCPLPEPPLCGELCCQIVYPPCSDCPQLVCRDACGRTFLKVEGTKVNFDPFIMECEARRAASVCPPSGADRIKQIRDSLDVCGAPRDTDSCDRKLQEICNDAEDPTVCKRDKQDTVCKKDGDQDQGQDQIESDDQGAPVCKRPKRKKGDGTGGGKGDGGYDDDEDDDDGACVVSEPEYVSEEDGKKCEIIDDEGRRIKATGSVCSRAPSQGKKRQTFSQEDTLMSITVKFVKHRGGRRMEVDMQGYCPDDGHAPRDITALRVFANADDAIDFDCTPKDYSDTDDAKSVRSTKTERSSKSKKSQKSQRSPVEQDESGESLRKSQGRGSTRPSTKSGQRQSTKSGARESTKSGPRESTKSGPRDSLESSKAPRTSTKSKGENADNTDAIGPDPEEQQADGEPAEQGD